MAETERIRAELNPFWEQRKGETKIGGENANLTEVWSMTNRNTRYTRSQSVADVDHHEYSSAEIRRIRERLLRSHAPKASAIRAFSRKQKLTLTSLALVDFMSFCSMSIMAPFFPKEAALKGMNDITSGFVFSFYAFIMFISSPIFGKILPRVGAKTLFMTGMLIAGLCNILFGLLEYIDNYTLFTTFCFMVRGFEALGASAYSTASYVFVVNMFPTHIGAVLGILETFVGLGMSAGPAIGGLLYSLGGFGMPFYVLGVLMVIVVPMNFCLLPAAEDCNVGNKSGSIFDLLKLPSVLVTGTVVVVVSNTWGFLDPTLEPHLRQFNLTPEKIGLIFLMFSALYGISSPVWGWLADKCNNHWSMMVWGLLLSTIGLLLLGPSPYLPFLPQGLWLNIVGLSILGVSVALTLLPTFQRVLTSAIDGGCPDSLSTCSLVAGLWSCMYALGEVLGPALGGVLLQHLGFPMAASIQAAATLILALLIFVYFSIKNACCSDDEMSSDSGISGSWKSTTVSDDTSNEKQPLLGGMTSKGSGHSMYTSEKEYYEHRNRTQSDVENSYSKQMTNVRKMIGITAQGSCEV